MHLTGNTNNLAGYEVKQTSNPVRISVKQARETFARLAANSNSTQRRNSGPMHDLDNEHRVDAQRAQFTIKQIHLVQELQCSDFLATQTAEHELLQMPLKPGREYELGHVKTRYVPILALLGTKLQNTQRMPYTCYYQNRGTC